ncbi:MAG TPA: ATP-binding protein [Drouetiella sp.]
MNSRPAIAIVPRLQTLNTLKKLWSEYSALIVQSRMHSPSTEQVEKGERVTCEQSTLNARVQDIGARWKSEARAIQFDFEFNAVEQERRRVAKELHDEILPSLARLARSLEPLGADGATLVDAILKTNATFRDLLGELHPVDLEELGFVAALQNICQRYARLTERVVLFFERTEVCNLSELQQLALFRAVQCILKMFSASSNDILTVTYSNENGCTAVTIRCADKLVSSTDWISATNAEFNSFEAWAGLAGAQVAFNICDSRDQFPSDVRISVPDEPTSAAATTPQNQQTDELSQIRLKELDEILSCAKAEWSRLIDRDRALFESLAIEAERNNIVVQIDNLVVPRLKDILLHTTSLSDLSAQMQVAERMKSILSGVNGVLSELHPRLFNQIGLIESVQKLVSRFQRASLIDTRVSTCLSDLSLRLSPETKFAIYRVTQEALNNIEKHSGATQARVSIARNADILTVSIEDNGKGIQGKANQQIQGKANERIQGKANALSRGFKNIHERATAIGASVEWRRSENFSTGTILLITLVEAVAPR